MTLESKVAQLGTVRIGSVLIDGSFDPARARETIPHGIGRVTRVGRESGLKPAELAGVIAEIQSFLRTETPHGIPAFVREESLCGYAGRRGATIPQAIGMASSWDPALVADVSSAVGDQLRAVGCQLTLSPVCDLGVEPRWGRIEETFGEDPALASTMTERVVSGLADSGVDATLKHFVGHGRPAGGRNRARSTASLHEMRDADLRPFRVGIEADVPSVMAAYNTVDGVPCHANTRLLTDLLREEWGFTGTVVSDGRGIEMLADDYGIAPDRQAAGVDALTAGIDVELPETECFGDRLVEAVRDGLVDESEVDRAVGRHLRQKRRAGLFTDSGPDPETAAASFGTPAIRSLTRRAGRRSQVILDNDGLLPLSTDTSVALVGPNADAPRNLLGNYSYAGAENQDGGVEIVTPRAALRKRVDDLRYARSCGIRAGPDDDVEAAVTLAREADVVVACVGGQSGIDVERDSPGTAGEALDRAALGLPEVVDDASATVAAWLPGQEGGAADADVLLGADPGGRLPVSLPQTVGQLPVDYRQSAVSRGDYVFTDGGPLFPFGHGESYAAFSYGSLSATPSRLPTDGSITVTVTVKNVAARDGTEVVQLYACHRGGSTVRPIRELVGFQRLDLAAGERATVQFDLSTATLATHDATEQLIVESGAVDLAIGRSSGDIRLQETVTVTGEAVSPDSRPPVADTTVVFS